MDQYISKCIGSVLATYFWPCASVRAPRSEPIRERQCVSLCVRSEQEVQVHLQSIHSS